MKITIREVAKEANVSMSTVSRVLYDSPEISEKTKIIVREVIKRLKYKPNEIARSLAKKKSRILGIVLPNEAKDFLTNSFFMQVMKGMSLYAQSKKYNITYAFSEDNATEEEHINDFVNSNLVDGVCLLRTRSEDKSIKCLKEAGFPFVVIGRPEEPEGIMWVDNDNFQATYNLVNELIEKGCKNIAFLGAKKEWNVTKDRFEGFRMSCNTNGISITDKNVIMVNEFNEQEGRNGAIRLLENTNPTAIIAQDDILAFGVLKVLKERNIKNVKVVGFNNSPLAQFQTPPLSSVDINPVELGYYAIKILIDFLENNEMAIKHHIIDSKLIKRESFE